MVTFTICGHTKYLHSPVLQNVQQCFASTRSQKSPAQYVLRLDENVRKNVIHHLKLRETSNTWPENYNE
jgi:hypothetical protein